MRIAYFTAMVGDAEAVNFQPRLGKRSSVDVFIFTDRKRNVPKNWREVTLKIPADSHPEKIHKTMKLSNHSQFSAYDMVVYFDNKVIILGDPIRLARALLGEERMGFFEHSYRDSLKEEFDVNIMNFSDSRGAQISSLFGVYEAHKPELLSQPFTWNGIFCRLNNDADVDALMSRWKDATLSFGYRDQLTKPLVVSIEEFKFNTVKVNNFFSRAHIWPISANIFSPSRCLQKGTAGRVLSTIVGLFRWGLLILLAKK